MSGYLCAQNSAHGEHIKNKRKLGLVAQICNPSYLGGRDRSRFKDNPGEQCDPISTNKKLGVGVHACHPSCERSVNRRMAVQATLGMRVRPYLEKPKAERAGSMDPVLEPLPSKSEVLSSNPSIGKKTNQNRK
jgi:hypothetical protein